eukprot:5200907-Amphidinium_carterae.2
MSLERAELVTHVDVFVVRRLGDRCGTSHEHAESVCSKESAEALWVQLHGLLQNVKACPMCIRALKGRWQEERLIGVLHPVQDHDVHAAKYLEHSVWVNLGNVRDVGDVELYCQSDCSGPLLEWSFDGHSIHGQDHLRFGYLGLQQDVVEGWHHDLHS